MTRLVLLPGLHGTAELFAPFLRALPRGVAATPVSYPREGLLGYDALLPIARAALPRREPFLLLGESFSGPLAIRIAADPPPNLRGLVLCVTFARSPVPEALRWMHPLVRPPFTGMRPTRTVVRSFLTGRGGPDEVVDLVIDVAVRGDPAVRAHRVREVLHVDVRPLLPRIRVPTLYLRAARDRVVLRPWGLEPIAAAMPDLQTAVINGYHLLLQTRPAEATAEILRFAERV